MRIWASCHVSLDHDPWLTGASIRRHKGAKLMQEGVAKLRLNISYMTCLFNRDASSLE